MLICMVDELIPYHNNFCSISYNSIGAEGAVAISEAVKTLKDLQEL